MNKSCPKCFKEFQCKSGEITACSCTNMPFTETEEQAILSRYNGCLCSHCLTEIRTDFDKPARIYISFQDAQYEADLCILSKEDTTIDSHGNKIDLFEGKQVDVYEYDEDENNVRDDIVASGTVEKNLSDFKPSARYKWSIRLDENGMQFESKLRLMDLLETWKRFGGNYAHTERYIYEWQNDMDCRRLIDELIEKFLYLKSNKYTYITELEEIDKIVLEKTFEVNKCIWKNTQYNSEKHWYYFRMNQLVFEQENEEFTKK
jgi:Cysteine-rich CWC